MQHKCKLRETRNQSCILAHQSFYEISNNWMLKYSLSPEQQVKPEQLFFSSYETNIPAGEIIKGLLTVILNLLHPIVSLVEILCLNKKETHSLGIAITIYPCGPLKPVWWGIMDNSINSRPIVSGFKYQPCHSLPLSPLVSTLN